MQDSFLKRLSLNISPDYDILQHLTIKCKIEVSYTLYTSIFVRIYQKLFIALDKLTQIFGEFLLA